MARGVGMDPDGGAVDGPGPGPHGAQHARCTSARLDRCATSWSRVRPTWRLRGRRSAASCPVTPVFGTPQLGPSVSVEDRDAPAHGLVQGAGRPGRRVGHAGGGSRPCRGRLLGRQPRARSGLRGLQAGRAGDRRRAHGSVRGEGLGAPAVRRAPRPPRRRLPRGGDARARAGRVARGAATSRPTTIPTSSPASRRSPASSLEQVPEPRHRRSSPAAAAGCSRASSSAWRDRACASSASSPRRRPP